MVNHGVSHACLTCKTRRIRCDERRPICERCTKSKRTCLGYEGEINTTSEASVSNLLDPKPAVSSTPVTQTLDPSLNQLDVDPEVQKAFTKFFSDFVLVSKDRTLSRGYFDGLEHLLARAGFDSVVVRAARVVALANAANSPGSHDLLYKACAQYPDTLVAFQQSLNDSTRCNNDEALMTAAMLGLFEMMVATEAYPNAHNAHVQGVSAILCTRPLPLDLLPGVRLFQCFNSSLSSRTLTDVQTPGIFSPQLSSEAEPFTRNLDSLMLRSRPVLLRATKLLSNPKASRADLAALKQQATLLNKEFSLWPLSQPKEWAPKTLGVLEKGVGSADMTIDSIPFWPGKIDSYFDLYVVAVWDVYRKGRLKLLQVVANCSERLGRVGVFQEKPVLHQRLQSEVQELVDGLCASIPFHLVADLPSCLQRGGTIDDLNIPAKALGGLLLMYPLYIASTLPLVPSDQRAWMKGRLRWIGRCMGIRQATMLANVCLITMKSHSLYC